MSVIAVAYDHERFVEECLDSIAAQTLTDIELIVADDCSRDDSAQAIARWIGANAPHARFLRHERNVGLTRTLNEALALARGKYVAIIAADDVWERNKLERQVAALEALPTSYAVAYADAWQIDESGKLLPERFIAAHRPDLAPPQGEVFNALAERNFIPAMATLVRREAIEAVGGYDERLAYEDWDMWLRLALRYRFAYVPEPLARYRVVASSLARTLLAEPSAARSLTHLLIGLKCLASGRLSPALRAHWKARLLEEAYDLYGRQHPRAARHLLSALRSTGDPRFAVLALLAACRITKPQVRRIKAALTWNARG